MRNKKTNETALATTHKAFVARARNINEFHRPQQHATVIPNVISIHDWLIDSGATAHMTHSLDDFNGPLTPFESLVETANGGVIHVTHRGNVDIYLEDIFRPGNSIIVEVRNVLYVPGLTRRLISVSEWNACGGQILHLRDRTRVQVYNDDDEIDAVIDLPPCPGGTGEGVQIHSVRAHRQRSKQTHPRIKIPQSLLHRRLGHRSMSSILMANEDDLWDDVKITEDRDEFCEICSITTARKASTGRGNLEALGSVVPGEVVMIDIVNNPSTESITSDTNFKFYLLIVDMASRFLVPIGIQDKKPKTVLEALKTWSTHYGPSESFNFSQLDHIHGDYDAVYRSKEFTRLAAEANIQLSFAAPRHQEQNGICESNWRHVRDLAFALMNQAQVDMTFFHYALQHAYKVHSVLPHRALTKEDGTVQCPAGVYFGSSVSISDFRVLFCPVVMTYDSVFVSNQGNDESNRRQPKLQQMNRKNNPQRGMRGIHVGVPTNTKGYLVYVPTMGKVYTSTDVYFDEDFNSTIAVRPNKFSGYMDLTITEAMPDVDLPMYQTGDSFAFAKRHDNDMLSIAKPFDNQPHEHQHDSNENEEQAMEEASVDSLFESDDEDQVALETTFQGGGIHNNNNKEAVAINDQQLETNSNAGGDNNEDDMSYHYLPHLDDPPTNLHEDDDDSVTTAGDIDEYDLEPPLRPSEETGGPTDDIPPPLLVQSTRRSQRKKFPTVRYTYNANSATLRNYSEIPEELHQYIQHTHFVEVTNSIETPTIDPLIPTPENWKQILRYPTHIKTLWIKSFVKELKELIKKGTVIRETPNPEDPIIPVTAKYRVKLTSDGQVDKLKTRIALRGDMMRETMFTPDTWCPIAGFRALRLFLAFAAENRQRIYQLDYVAAFLQADVIGRKFTKFPGDWRELLQDYPELHQWLGTPLRLKKSLYGDRVANLAWDETQSKWLTSPEIGFVRLPSEGSIYLKRTDKDFIAVLNAVDDQLYFATDPSLKKWFEDATQQRFDVQLMGQAVWYLQSRITQCTDYSIILDQSRYAALVLQKYLNGTSEAAITPQMKTKYATPTPTTALFTRRDCSLTYVDVMTLQAEFGFVYAAVVGSLIYLMNTYVRLNYAIRKLARFMQLPGRNHFKLLLHLLRHLQCYRLEGGIKFYSNITKSPLYRHLELTGYNNLTEFPIIVFTDSSFQDCPDSARSTGGFLIFMQGAVIDVTSTMPQLVSWSTCEAEYCMAALAVMAAFFIRKVYNELHGLDSDHQLTIPIGIDSQSAMDTAISYKETQRTRHFARRFHFIRLQVASSQVVLFKVDGTINCANSLTKPLPAEQLAKETEVYEVAVKP
jgi:transposase InsO family protein